MHWLVLFVVTIVAGVIAVVLLQRIYDAQQKLASLHDDLRRNDLKLQNQISQIEAQSQSTPAHGKTDIHNKIETEPQNLQEEEKP